MALIVLLVTLAFLGLLGYAALRPDEFTVARSVTVKALPEKIFPLINDLRAMNAWNPFVQADPAIQLSYSGAAAGTGARCDWEGNGQVGAGNISVTESRPSSSVVMQLNMLRPFAGQNKVVFSLEPSSARAGTTVTWAMTGTSTDLSKLMSVVMSMDKMVGGAFEKGLADLKARAERS
jgi:hypothetical protein